MSSMRNAAPRRPHRERAQPQARSKWGLLEKHKDYSLRAADYNLKKKKLGILAQKIKERNPDEFAFGMLSADKAKAGKHGRSAGTKNRLDHDVVEKLKTQDTGYLRTVLGRNRKELEKVKEEIGLDSIMKESRGGVAEKENRRKIVFDEDGQPLSKRRKQSVDAFDLDSEYDMDEDKEDFHSALEGEEDQAVEAEAIFDQPEKSVLRETSVDSDDARLRPKPKSKKQLLAEANALAKHKADKRRREKVREARTAKLKLLKKRQKSIMAAANELEMQRAKMAKTIGGTNKNGVVFKVRERKR